MVHNPTIGGRYWIITDYWEELYAVPVTIVAEAVQYRAFLGRLDTSNEFFEQYEGLLPEELYETEREAKEAIKRGVLPCGFIRAEAEVLEGQAPSGLPALPAWENTQDRED